MACKQKYKEDEVLSQLRKKHDVRITPEKEILVLNGKSNKGQFQKKDDLGNGSWGKIDFLVKHCGYRQMFVSEW